MGKEVGWMGGWVDCMQGPWFPPEYSHIYRSPRKENRALRFVDCVRVHRRITGWWWCCVPTSYLATPP